MMGPGYSEFPQHKIVTEPMKEKVEIFMEGDSVAETIHAIKVLEDGYPPRYYIPKEDLRNIQLIETKKKYHCPFKGDAKFYTVKHGASRFEDAAWAYEDPYDEVRELKGHVAFYPEKVQLIRVTG